MREGASIDPVSRGGDAELPSQKHTHTLQAQGQFDPGDAALAAVYTYITSYLSVCVCMLYRGREKIYGAKEEYRRRSWMERPDFARGLTRTHTHMHILDRPDSLLGRVSGTGCGPPCVENRVTRTRSPGSTPVQCI